MLEIVNREEQTANQDNDYEQDEDLAEFSFHAILGQTSVATMKLQATLSKKQVIIFG